MSFLDRSKVRINNNTTFSCSIQNYDYNSCSRDEFFKKIKEYEDRHNIKIKLTEDEFENYKNQLKDNVHLDKGG